MSIRNFDPQADYLAVLGRDDRWTTLRAARSHAIAVRAAALLSLEQKDELIKLLDSYDQLLQKLDDPSVRQRLTELSESEVYTDPYFRDCRELSHDLQVTLKRVFFELDTPLRKFAVDYGVF